MSRSTFWVLVLSCALSFAAYGQEPSSNQPPAPPAAVPATTVPMDQAVITLKGMCQPKAGATAPPAGCVSSLTREQFEKMIKALQQPGKPPMPPDVVRRFASQYAKLLVFADTARELGLENDPRVLEIVQFTRNQILTDALNQHVIQEYSHIPDQQIEDYYKQNPKKYVEGTLQRIIIPRSNAGAGKPKPTDAEEQAYANKIRERWVAGEDPVKLQKEAMEHAGMTTTPPDVNVGARRPGTLPEAHESVFDLKAGEVSQVFSDPGSQYIYKLVSVRQLPLSDVKSSIESTLQRQMITDKIEKIQSSATIVLNEAYFGPEVPPTVHKNILTPRRGAGAPDSGSAPPNPNAAPAPAEKPETPPK
ncbi:MAG: peptidyl-prolyl cis-trans isomerase [Candidatus Korobacteraceae bacterium]